MLTNTPVAARTDAADGPPAWAQVVDALARHDVAVLADALPRDSVAALRAEALACDATGRSRTAQVGRAAARHVDAGVRGDRIAWLSPPGEIRAEAPYHAAMAALQLCLNRALMLGLAELEAHYAVFPPGAFYRRHRDRFRDDDARQVSVILYLNEAWTPADGGALRIHRDAAPAQDILPLGGTLVAFAADGFEHEVLPANRTRVAITGWFRRRPALPW